MFLYFKKLLVFSVIGFFVLVIMGEILISKAWLGTIFPNIITHYVGQHKITQRKVIIGDSLAGQLFDGDGVDDLHNEYFIHPLTQAHSLIGQYILLVNLFRANPAGIDEVILAVTPQTLSNNADQVYTYRSILGDLFQFDNLEHFSPTALRLLSRWKPFFLLFFSIFKANPGLLAFDYGVFAPPNYNHKLLTYNPAFLSELSIDYLKRLKRLSILAGAKFSVILCPISDKGHTDLSSMKRQVAENGLSDIFTHTFDRFFTLPEFYFSEDDLLHIKRPLVGAIRPMAYARYGIRQYVSTTADLSPLKDFAPPK